MNTRMWGIIGGVVLVLALLSPLVLGSSKKVEQLFEAAETLYERSDYKGAIPKYKEALKESKKFGAKTQTAASREIIRVMPPFRYSLPISVDSCPAIP